MQLPERLTTRTYDMVAKTNGVSYSYIRQKDQKWQHYKAPDYVEYNGEGSKYRPYHLRALRTACKLLIAKHWPGFANDPSNQKVLQIAGAIK